MVLLGPCMSERWAFLVSYVGPMYVIRLALTRMTGQTAYFGWRALAEEKAKTVEMSFCTVTGTLLDHI